MTAAYDVISVTTCDTIGDEPVVITEALCRLGECVSCDKRRGIQEGDEIPPE